MDTSLRPIGGGADFPVQPADMQAASTVLTDAGCPSAEMATRWLERYGVHKARAICEMHKVTRKTEKCFGRYSSSELEWIVANESVQHLDDLLMRRTQIAVTGEAVDHLEATLALVGDTLSWSEQRREAERNRISHLLREHHAVS